MSAALRSLPSHAPRTAEGVLAEVTALVGQLRCASARDRTSPPHASRQPARPDRGRGLSGSRCPPTSAATRRTTTSSPKSLRKISRGCPFHRLDVHDHVGQQSHSGASGRRGGGTSFTRRPELEDYHDHRGLPARADARRRWLPCHRSVDVEHPLASTAIGSPLHASCPAKRTQGCD